MTVRLGIIGLGNIGMQHIGNIKAGEVTGGGITAICATKPNSVAEALSAEYFADHRELIASGVCDAVIVATPTFTHYHIGEAALDAGLHVLMEKPVGLSGYEGEQLLSHATDQTKFAVMLNQRMDPVYVKMRSLVNDGGLGEIQRTNWTMTNWFRPDIYYQVSDWRATWRGEGGGLLVNQCIHNLDIFQWICGMPAKVHGHCQFGKYHDIEVEDEAIAYFEYAHGATGCFVGSTGEAPGFNRFDIVGDQATLSYDGTDLRIMQNDIGSKEYCRTTDEMFGMPVTTETTITPTEKVNQHALILQNFIDAINGTAELVSPATESLDSLNLANAILLSSWTQSPIDMPISTRAYQAELSKRIKDSSLREKSDAKAKIDLQKSFH